MNLQNNNQGIFEPINPCQETVFKSCSHNDSTGPGHGKREIPVTKGKSQGWLGALSVISCAALCIGLSSCMYPYEPYGERSVTITRYSPGYTVSSLPGGYRSENITGITYYYYDGHYYQRGSVGYVVVDAPRGSRYYDDYVRRQRNYDSRRNYPR
jgi:hypothetical protein